MGAPEHDACGYGTSIRTLDQMQRQLGIGETAQSLIRTHMVWDARAAAATLAAKYKLKVVADGQLPTSRRREATLRIAHWNMARLTKIQVQMLDALPLDLVMLSETHGTAAPLAHYSGPNHLLTPGAPDEWLDPAGAVATWMTAHMTHNMGS